MIETFVIIYDDTTYYYDTRRDKVFKIIDHGITVEVTDEEIKKRIKSHAVEILRKLPKTEQKPNLKDEDVYLADTQHILEMLDYFVEKMVEFRKFVSTEYYPTVFKMYDFFDSVNKLFTVTGEKPQRRKGYKLFDGIHMYYTPEGGKGVMRIVYDGIVLYDWETYSPEKIQNYLNILSMKHKRIENIMKRNKVYNNDVEKALNALRVYGKLSR